MGAMLSSLVPAAVVGETGVLYDIDKFIYLGTPYSGHPHIFISRNEAGVSSLEKLRSTPGQSVTKNNGVVEKSNNVSESRIPTFQYSSNPFRHSQIPA